MVFVPRVQGHAQSLFPFPIVFGNNLMHEMMGRTIWDGAGLYSIIYFGGLLGLRSLTGPFERVGSKSDNVFGNGKCELSCKFQCRNGDRRRVKR